MGKKIADVVNDLQAGDPAVDGAAATVAQVKSMILEALQAGITIDQVAQQITDTLAAFQTGLNQTLGAFVTQAQLVDSYLNPLSTRVGSLEGMLSQVTTVALVKELIAAAVEGLAPIHAVIDSTSGAVTVPDQAKAKGPIDPKYLAGLRYRTSQPRRGGPNDDDSTVHEPVVRDLAPGDVLNWVEKDGKISFVTGDGQRVSVPK